MLRNKVLFLTLGFIFILFFSYVAVPINAQSASQNQVMPMTSNPQTFGKIADNGVVVGIWYSGFLSSQNPIIESSVIHTNSLFVTIINTHNTSLSFTMYGNLYGSNLSKSVDNISVIHTVAPLSEMSYSLNLPIKSGSFFVKFTYRNIEFTFTYTPVKALFPANINTNAQKITFALEIIFEVALMAIIASIIASLMLKRMFYFPKSNISSVILILLGLGVVIFIFINAVYLYLLSIPYYAYLIPVFIMILFLELQLRHGDLKECVFISISNNEHNGKEIPVFDDGFYIHKDKNKHYVIDSESTIKAFKRLIGLYTYMDIDKEYIHYTNIDGNREYYFLEPSKNYRSAIVTKYKEYGNGRFSKHIRFKHYKINLSNNAHIGDVISVLSGIRQTNEIAKDKNAYLNENMELKAKIANGSMKANFKFLYKFSKLISTIKDIIPENELQLIESEIKATQDNINKEAESNKNIEGYQ